MPQSAQVERSSNKPIQARALRTEQALLDALDSLLSRSTFQDLTVSQIASEAGVTTGAIYRRFKDKEDMLHSAFVRFYERTKESARDISQRYAALNDREALELFLQETMEFTLANAPLMRAANSVNDDRSFELMTAARSLSAQQLANLIHSSPYEGEDLEQRCKFVLRIATAAFRDTFLSGPSAVWNAAQYMKEHQQDVDLLLSRLHDIAVLYLRIDD